MSMIGKSVLEISDKTNQQYSGDWVDTVSYRGAGVQQGQEVFLWGGFQRQNNGLQTEAGLDSDREVIGLDWRVAFQYKIYLRKHKWFANGVFLNKEELANRGLP